ncbi:MAG: DUF218 domain-containing protein [Peptococcaceae bacterium]|nr:DUF218 domain-containing protein [Peptococcaceae bacterium]
MSQTLVQSTPKKKTLKKLLQIIGILAFLGIAAIFSICFYVSQVGKPYLVTPETAPAVDAILILGARVYSDGRPSPLLQDRLDYGYRLYAAGKADRIIVSGDHGRKDYDEVNAMKNYLLTKGVPPEHIFLDHAGFNTYDSLYRAKEIFQVKSLIVCTQEFHMPRALYIGRRLNLEAYGYAAPDKAMYHMAYNHFRERLAQVKAFLETDVLHRKPKYLGNIIPIQGSGLLTQI